MRLVKHIEWREKHCLFAVRLRLAMEGAGFVPRRLADALGVSKTLVSFWMNGKRLPSEEDMARIAVNLQVSVESLAG